MAVLHVNGVQPLGVKWCKTKVGEEQLPRVFITCCELACTDLCLSLNEEPVESLQVRINRTISVRDIVVDVCYRPPDEEENAFFRQLEEASHLQALVFMVRLQPHQSLLEGQHGRAQTIQEDSGMH